MARTNRRSLLCILLICARSQSCRNYHEHHDCGGVGCDSQFELFTAVPLPLEVVQTAEIEVCRNAVCHTGKFSVDSGVGKDGRSLPERTTATIELSSNQHPRERIFAEVVWANRSGVLALDVLWRWDWSTTPNARRDQYDISIQAEGSTLYSTRRTVDEYDVFQPNGAEPPCGGLTCGQASSVDEPLPEEVRQQLEAKREGNDEDAGPQEP